MNLLIPMAVGKLVLKNRIVMPAIATNFGHVDGSVSDRLIQYYRARAEGGVALIIVEFTAVAFEGRFTQNQLRIDQDRSVEGFSRLVEVLHKAGARTMLQLHHSGRRSPRNVTMTQAMAPSAIPIFPGAPIPREMNRDDINHVREAFIQGSVRARQAGFDGVEIHATHGYLLAQFLSPLSNLRSDAYGDSVENRARLPLEILRGIKEGNGQDFPVLVKMTGDEYTPFKKRRGKMKKYESCIKKPYDSTSEHHQAHHTKKHHDEAMPRWTFCGDGYFPESPVRIVVRQIKSIPPDYDPHIDLHTHDRDELYLFISEEDGGLEAEVTLGDEVYQVKSPVTILLPKGVPHKYVVKKGHGFLFTIFPMSCAEQYNRHTFPYKG